ncbi:MAG: midcut-by-XrtH protein [Ottowia sp.]|nr:midcut-by-XrtH protein [Ottowia sp.]
MGRWMKRASFRAVLRNVEVLLVAGLAGSAAWGQSAVVTYAPGGIAAVPTLADAALLMLVAAVALVAWRWLRWRGGGPGALAVFLLAGLVWASGAPMMREARAVVSTTLLDHAEGGSVTVIGGGTFPLQNAAGVDLHIAGVTPAVGTTVGAGSTCVPGKALTPGTQCTLILSCSPQVPTQLGLERPQEEVNGWGC